MGLAEMTDAYLAGAQRLRRAVRGMTPEQTRARPVPGKWSTLEVVCHLADIDALDAERVKRLIALDRPTLMDCDQDLYAAKLAYMERDCEEEVLLIEHARRQLARVLRTRTDTDLARAGDYHVGDKVETRTVEQVLTKAIRHFAHHIPFILDKRRALGLPEV